MKMENKCKIKNYIAKITAYVFFLFFFILGESLVVFYNSLLEEIQ